MIPVEINDYAARAIALLLEQFKGKPNWQSLVTIITSEVQEIETAGFQLYTLRLLDSSIGTQLDNLGDTFGTPRNGASDADYRNAIKFTIFELNSSGTTAELLTILKTVTNADNVQAWNVYPAGIQLLTDGIEITSDLYSGMLRQVAGGVALWIYLSYGYLPLGFDVDSLYLLSLGGSSVLGLSGGKVLGLSYGHTFNNPNAGTFCDIDGSNTIIPYENSARMIDVLQG